MDTPIDGFWVQLIQAVHWNFDGLNFYFRQTWRTLYFYLFTCYKISKKKNLYEPLNSLLTLKLPRYDC